MSAVRRSSRQIPGRNGNVKVQQVTKVIEGLCSQQLAIAGTLDDSDMDWMTDQLQVRAQSLWLQLRNVLFSSGYGLT